MAVRICARFCFCGKSISKNAFRRFESDCRPENPEMHLQNFEKLQSQKIAPIRFDGLGQEKSLEISRFLAVWLAKRLFPSFGSKLTCHHGWGGRIRTDECQSQSLVPYRLATPQFMDLYPNSIPQIRLRVKTFPLFFRFFAFFAAQ